MYKYTYECTLYNKGEIEENFTIDITAIGQWSAKDEIENLLTHDYGHITKRLYQGEKMKSDRHWDIELRHIVINSPEEEKKD